MKASIVVIVGDRKKRGGRNSCSIERPGLKMIWVESIADAEYHADVEPLDLVLFALNSSDSGDELSACRRLLQRHKGVRVMLFSDESELQATLAAIEALPAGQFPALFSPVSESGAAAVSKQVSTSTRIPALPGVSADVFSYKGLIGDSPEIRKLKNLLVKIAPTGTTILLQGESGTGKEVIARSIHYHSSRDKEVFIPVDCAAISENIIESELFGHAKGAFTGADRATLGLIRSADKGTLFLDEIGELPLPMQAKLLRTLQERAVKPVGDTRIYPVDIRIVAATNRNLAEAVKKGTFRQDLYYRLNAITIYAPPLREHRQDIPFLCDHFMSRLVQEGYPEKSISTDAMDALCAYDWPGNIRELENVVRRAVTLASGPKIDPESLAIDVISYSSPDEMAEDGYASVASHEKEAIRKALNRTSGNRKAAAELLDISEATLYRRLRIYSL
jgi:DNA-binding NtrC family response regulator